MSDHVMTFTDKEEEHIRKLLMKLVDRLCVVGTSSEISTLPNLLTLMFPGSGRTINFSTTHNLDDTPPVKI